METSSRHGRQKIIARSSAEAELYAMTKCATQTLGMIQLKQDFNIVLKGVVHTDSSAALGIVSRVGIGRTRHIQVQYLCLQGTYVKMIQKQSKLVASSTCLMF